MKIIAAIMAAGLMAGFVSLPANAAPQATQMSVSQPTATVEQIQIRRRALRNDNVFDGNRRFRGNRNMRSNRDFGRNRGYRNGPRGWNRYSSRPRNYRSRGCIIIGPVWYCP